MGAVRKRVHNNPQVIHTTPVHQFTSYQQKSCVFLTLKYFTLNRPKYASIIQKKSNFVRTHQNPPTHLLRNVLEIFTGEINIVDRGFIFEQFEYKNILMVNLLKHSFSHAMLALRK